jgi:hypothetical protein
VIAPPVKGAKRVHQKAFRIGRAHALSGAPPRPEVYERKDNQKAYMQGYLYGSTRKTKPV